MASFLNLDDMLDETQRLINEMINLDDTKDEIQRHRVLNTPSASGVNRLNHQRRMVKPTEKLLHSKSSSQSLLKLVHVPPKANSLGGSSRGAHSNSGINYRQQNPLVKGFVRVPPKVNSLGGSSRGCHSNSGINYRQHNPSVKAVPPSQIANNNPLPTGSSGTNTKYQGAKQKTSGFNARLSDIRENLRGANGGEESQYRRDIVCGVSNSRQGSPNRDGRRNQRFLSLDRGAKHKGFGSLNKENVEKEIGNIPRNMMWMVDLSELSGLEIVAKLANSHSGFQNVIKNIERLKGRPDLLVLTVKLLAKACDADFRENKSALLAQACHPEFLDQIANFMSNLPINGYKNKTFDVDDFLLNVLTFSKGVTILLPYTASERFRKILLFVDTTIRGFELIQKKSIRDDVKELHHSLQLHLNAVSEANEKKVEISSRAELLSVQAPPNDFHEINLIPTSEDIFSEEKAFVRPNLIRGAYASVEHYLDVQFRLLHEDFLSPMREGIAEYVRKVESNKLRKGKPITNVRLYRKVMFLNPKVVSDRIGIVVNFDPENRLKRMQWRNSKRFMYGSLLCFTQDNFRNIMFATVVEREEKDLQRGLVVVELCVGSQVREDLFRAEYTMAESEVYFEPYFQVLKALKDMSEPSFPMRCYIVEAQREGQPPAYLMTDPPVECTMEPGLNFPVLSLDLWPSAEQLGLDDSQYRAFRFALTKEFVVIQGPPGTGKTYLGLKVAGFLLENYKVWHADKQPILVVCYTNHALDQFLEGILQYTKKIVRVGGQSKCENLDEYNLKVLRRVYKKAMYRRCDDDEDEESVHVRLKNNNNLGRDIHGRMEVLIWDIKRIQLDLELLQRNNGIISLESLHSVGAVGSSFYRCFRYKYKEEEFVDWLLSQKEYQDPNFVIHVKHDDNEANEVSDVNEEEEAVENDGGGRITRDLHEGYDFNTRDIQGELSYADSLETLKRKQRDIENEKGILINEHKEPSIFHRRMWLCEEQLMDIGHKLERLEQRLKEKMIPSETEIQRLLQRRDIWRLNFNERWTLYRHWIALLRTQLLEKFQTLEESFRTEAKQYEEVRHMIDLEIMRDSFIVGMTTTGAARLQTLLQALKPKIVIVEEAAEVLESHITVSLTSQCQHLILIGDHQQLRPTTSVYRLAKEFGLDVSLFERMLNNGMHCEVLKVQHRMRPEIARLIVPAIYPELLNHRTVKLFEEIQGVSKSLFFINHDSPDEEVGDSFSRRNVHEADFLLALCRHLVLQGYEPDTITILATYTAQMFYMKNERKKYELLENVRITVVDNFQGEESDIILLSLVRSNENANIGFLKIENRVCVALSRARKGMYIMGNMENLVRSSDIWPKIEEVLIAQESIGRDLELRCQVHPEQTRIVSKAEDFEEIPEGGCGLICDALLNCGHNCQSVCHPKDREHKEYKCHVQPCDKEMCVLGHKCKKPCFEDCGPCMVMVMRQLPCGHELELLCHVDYERYACQVKVQKELPDCKHQIPVPCHQDPETAICTIPCDARLDDCGHTCRSKCHIKDDPDHLDYKCLQPCLHTNAECSQNHACTKRCHEECGKCEMLVTKVLPACRHKFQMICSQDPATFECKKKCERTMKCGHRCHKICSEKCGGCSKLVIKTIPICGHEIRLRCSDTPLPDMCRQPCQRLLKCGHNCTSECGQICTTKCVKMVESSIKAACSHVVKLPCYKLTSGVQPTAEELLSYCSAPCGAELKCEHVCTGTCSKCLQGRIHVPCNEHCGKILICGHSCDTPCSTTCPPCNKKCMLRCYHNSCKKKCGQPCTPCHEKCFWVCEHYRCTRLCYEPCNRPPCYAPCPKVNAKCGHPCIGYCGERCPQLCRVCDEEEVKTVVFGYEDEEDARFVYLEDCKHSIESRALEKWLKTSDGQIKMPVCPLCKTVIKKNTRYSNIIKPQYAAVCEVKHRVFGEMNYIERNRKEYTEKLKAIPSEASTELRRPLFGPRKFITILEESGLFVRVYNKILESFDLRTKKKQKNVLSNVDMETLGLQCEILCQLAAKAKKIEPYLVKDVRVKVLKKMNLVLEVIGHRGKHMSTQEIDDLNLEVQRFHRIADMCILESLPTFKLMTEGTRRKYETDISGPLMSIAKYSMQVDKTVKKMLEAFAKALKLSQVHLDEERKQIVKAVGMKQGHWFKCPNGHMYVIGECGGANQIGKCNECGAQIGGTNHRLIPGNSLASEMDGAQFPAWSDASNMVNYQLEDLD